VSFESGLSGAALGMNANDLTGCFGLSNPISVVREDCPDPCAASGGVISGGPFTFCVGDGSPDFIPAGAIGLSGNSGTNSQWVVTDVNGVILGLPGSPSEVDFDVAGVGTCLIWNLSFEDGLTGATVGANANDLMGCFGLSNPISVIREDCTPSCPAVGGTLTGGPFTFCVGDGTPDFIPNGAITLSGATGTNLQWIEADFAGNIIALHSSPYVQDFDSSGLGTCVIMNISYENGLTGLAAGMNTNDLVGCFDLSNPIGVIRENCGPAPCQVDGGQISGGPFIFCVGDGTSDFISAGSVALSGNSGTNSQWILTDGNGFIFGLPGSPSDFDFDELEPDTCQLWNISYENGLTGLTIGSNVSMLNGCFSLSNSINVVKENCPGVCPTETVMNLFVIGNNNLMAINQTNGQVEEVIPLVGFDSDRYGGMIYNPNDDAIYTIGDNNSDPTLLRIDRYTGQVTVIGEVTQVSPTFSDLTVSESLEYNPDDGLVYMAAGFTTDLNNNFFSRQLYTLDLTTGDATLVADFNGSCQDEGDALAYLNGVMYYTDGCPSPQSFGTVDLTTGNQTQLFSGVPDSRLENNSANSTFWFVTTVGEIFIMDLNGNTQQFGQMYPYDSLEGLLGRGLTTAPMTRTVVHAGALFGGPFEICDVNPSFSDEISDSTVTLQNPQGANSQWVLTSADGNVIGLYTSLDDLDFSNVVDGNYNIWHMSYEGNNPATIGMNATALNGCFDLSNPLAITVYNCLDNPKLEILDFVKPSETDDFVVYPNPTSASLIRVTFDSRINLDDSYSDLIVYDNKGQIVKQVKINSEEVRTYELQTGGWAGGVYWIKAYSEKSTIVKRFIKVR